MLNITQLIIFFVITGVSLAIMIYLLAEDSDIADMPLVPFFLTVSIFGIIGAIMTLIEIGLTFILIIASVVSVGVYFVTYYGFKSIITNPHELKKYIGMKGVVEISINPGSTGRIKILNTEYPESFPAKSNQSVPKNSEVFIEKFTGAIASVVLIPGGRTMDENAFITCINCKANVDIGKNDYCPYCGKKLE